MLDLTGRVALITGSSRGLGKAIALKLAQSGADLVINFANQRASADETAAQIAGLGRRVAQVQADLTEPEDIAAMVSWIGETFGRLDVVVCTEFDANTSSLLQASPAQVDKSLHGTLRPLIFLAQAAAPLLAKSPAVGRFIAVSRVERVANLLSATQAAVSDTVHRLAVEFGSRGGTTNLVRYPAEMPVDLAQRSVSDAVLFFASSLSNSITGQTLTVGQSAGEGCKPLAKSA